MLSPCSLGMLFTCTSWRAAVLAAPHLLPAAALSLPELDDADADVLASEGMLQAAAALNPLTWRVTIRDAGSKPQVGIALLPSLSVIE